MSENTFWQYYNLYIAGTASPRYDKIQWIDEKSVYYPSI